MNLPGWSIYFPRYEQAKPSFPARLRRFRAACGFSLSIRAPIAVLPKCQSCGLPRPPRPLISSAPSPIGGASAWPENGGKMDYQPVTSTSVAAIGYDPDTNTLGVRFLNGGEFHYYGVSADVFEGMKAAT